MTIRYWQALLTGVIAAGATCGTTRADETLFFPIMAWGWAPGDPAVLAQMKACGITVAGFVEPKNLDACHAAGLKALVYDPRVSGYDHLNVNPEQARTNIAALVAEVTGHPAVIGYYVRDEPSREHFAGLAVLAKLVKEYAPGMWPYINMFPGHDEQYIDYLEKFIAACDPPILSYDRYALFEHEPQIHPVFWDNLELMRFVAQRHGIPFWNIVLCTSHFRYREVTAADLRLQAYGTLAYGGRGISYFMYFTPSVGNYRMGPIDQFGNQTPTYYAMQNTNLQVLKLAPTLLKLALRRVYHTAEPPRYSFAPDEESLVSSVDDGPCVIGEFVHEDGSVYVMIVNKDVARSHPCNPVFRVEPKQVEMVSPYSGGLVRFEGEHRWLAPGQGVLLRLTYEQPVTPVERIALRPTPPTP